MVPAASEDPGDLRAEIAANLAKVGATGAALRDRVDAAAAAM